MKGDDTDYKQIAFKFKDDIEFLKWEQEQFISNIKDIVAEYINYTTCDYQTDYEVFETKRTQLMKLLDIKQNSKGWCKTAYRQKREAK